METRDQAIRRLYTREHLTQRAIGRQLGISAAAVYKRLQRLQVPRQAGTWVEVRCDQCGAAFQCPRARWRKSRRHYCATRCYLESRANYHYRQNRHGQRLARRVVAQLFPLDRLHVVHHWDGDNLNNEPTNLAVFASQSDHIAHHHGSNRAPIWDGRTHPL